MESPNSKYPRLTSEQLAEMGNEAFKKYCEEMADYRKQYARWELQQECDRRMYVRSKVKEIYPAVAELARKYLGKKIVKVGGSFTKIGDELNEKARFICCEGVRVYLSVRYSTLYVDINGLNVSVGGLKDCVLESIQVDDEDFLKSWMNQWNLVTTPEIIEDLEAKVDQLEKELRDTQSLLAKHRRV